MKSTATFAFIAILVATPSLAVAQQATSQGQLAPAFKAKKLTRAELQSIGGFPAYLSIQSADLETGLAWIPKDRTIVTVSNHAARAGRAADLLTTHGFTVAGAIGAQDYEAEGGTLVKVTPPAPRASSN